MAEETGFARVKRMARDAGARGKEMLGIGDAREPDEDDDETKRRKYNTRGGGGYGDQLRELKDYNPNAAK